MYPVLSPQTIGRMFSSLRWCQGHRFIPKSERKTKYGSKGSFSIQHGNEMLPTDSPNHQFGKVNGNIGVQFGNIVGNMTP